MDGTAFDRWTRRQMARATGGLVAVLLGTMSTPPTIDAGKRNRHNKRKGQKLERNRFGCVNVGGGCRGRDNVCCSGICEGKKPKRGEPDRSRCVAHHQGPCSPAHHACADDEPTACHPDLPYFCYRTTGNAGCCGWNPAPACFSCRTDADCHQVFGDGAACAVCPSCPDGGETMCVMPVSG